MAIYKLIETPFGNFLAEPRGRSTWGNGIDAYIELEPIGELTTPPTLPHNDYGEVIDWAAVHAEGARQRPEFAGSGLQAAPVFTINGKKYSGNVQVAFCTIGRHKNLDVVGTQYTKVDRYRMRSEQLTESANEQLGAWMQEHREEILDAEWLAEDEVRRTVAAVSRSQEALREAETKYSQANIALSNAFDAAFKAKEELKEIRGEK